jgi:hypothetical protein
VRKIAVLMLLGLWATGTAFGATITVNGDLSDWGVTVDYTRYDRPDSKWAPTRSGVAYWAEDTTRFNGEASRVGPGYGGQNFDVEAAYITSADGRLYAAFVSGFDREGQLGWSGSTLYQTGDLFFDLNPDGIPSWDFAIALSDHNGFLEGHAYIPSSPSGTWYTTPSDYPSSAPALLVAGGGFKELLGVQYGYYEGTDLDDNLYASTNPATYQAADHNTVEVSLNGSDLSAAFPGSTSVLMHYTQGCGNDVFDLRGDVLVPEPGTAILALAAVVAGAYARRRRKGERSCRTDVA